MNICSLFSLQCAQPVDSVAGAAHGAVQYGAARLSVITPPGRWFSITYRYYSSLPCPAMLSRYDEVLLCPQLHVIPE